MKGENLYESEAKFDESTLINPHLRDESWKTTKCNAKREKGSISTYSCTNSEEADGTEVAVATYKK